jgi:CBS domain containing-hemolysin-like protein
MSGLLAVIFGFALALSFLLSGMEAGVFALSRLRIRQQIRAGNRRAAVLHGYLERPENFLWTILVGNTLSNFTAFALIVGWLHLLLGNRPGLFALVFFPAVLLFYALFELLPKTLFRLYPNRLCMFLATPFGIVHAALRPLVSLTALFARQLLRWSGGKRFTGNLFGNRDEFRLIMQESAQIFSSEERGMINRVLDLQNITVRQITIPWHKTVSVDENASAAEMLAIFREKGFSRLPVTRKEDQRERIVGLVNLRSLIYEIDLDTGKTARDFLKPALYLDEDLRLEVALRRMQQAGQRLAIVLARDRSELGIISLHDILRVIFGEKVLA